MTTANGPGAAVRGRRSRPAMSIGLLAATAWVAVVSLLRGMGAMPGTMGLGFVAFEGIWMLTALLRWGGLVPRGSAFATGVG